MTLGPPTPSPTVATSQALAVSDRPPTGSRPRGRIEHRGRLWVVGAVILAAIGFLVTKGLGNSLVYFKTANEAVASRAALGGQTFRMEGVVVPGTVHQTAQGTDFSVESQGVSVPVVNINNPPQLFHPGVAVVVVGHFQGQGQGQGATFLSNQIMVKHSATYIAAHPGRVKAQATAAR